MSNGRSRKKIIWAIDIFEETGAIRNQCAEVLKGIAEKLPTQTEPVYIMSPDQLDLGIDLTTTMVKPYRSAVEKAVKQAVSGISFPGLKEPKVLVQGQPSLSRSIQTLTNYARNADADFIAVGTHGRRGLVRTVLGSFAESLLLSSKTPVLVIPPDSGKHARKMDRILFPTDFSAGSAKAFKEACKLAKELGAKITLLNSVPHPIEPALQSGVYLLGGGWVPVGVYLKSKEEEARKLGSAWRKRGESLGVDADFELDMGDNGIVRSILDAANQGKYGMIAMAAQSGKLSTALLGSVTRQVIRSSPCPVWVMRS